MTDAETENLPPIEEETLVCARVADSVPRSVWLLAIVGACERFKYYGLMAPLQNYMQNTIDDHLHPGALGLGQATATNLSHFFSFVIYLTPIGAAIIADNWLNRYEPCGYPPCLGGLITAMILIGTGIGAVKVCLTPLIADQYSCPNSVVKTLESGEQVIIDYDLTTESIFSILYWCTNVGSMSGLVTTWLEQKVGFWSDYLLLLCIFCIAGIILITSCQSYSLLKADMAAQVIV